MAVLDTAQLRDLGCNHCTNELFLVSAPQLGSRLDTLMTWAGALAALVGTALFVGRWLRREGPERRAQLPFLQMTAATSLASVLYLGFGAVGSYGVAAVFKWTQVVAFALVPLALGFALVQTRMLQASALRLFLARLSRAGAGDSLDEALAEALGDPSVRILYWLSGRGYADIAGTIRELPGPQDGRAVTYIDLDGQLVAAVTHHAWLSNDDDLIRAAGAAAALWFQRARLEAELRLRIAELKTSRARLVEAGDSERRRIERDLHDGAQQRLAALLVHAKLSRRALAAGDGDQAALLDLIETGLTDSLSQLRALASGILPPVLSDFGLLTAVEELVVHAPCEVVTDVLDERLDAPVEVAAYFTIAEALTNAIKHAGPTRMSVRVCREPGSVLVEVRDDGAGGASPDDGTGITGLADRVGALGGSLELISPAGRGTTVRATIPHEERHV